MGKAMTKIEELEDAGLNRPGLFPCRPSGTLREDMPWDPGLSRPGLFPCRPSGTWSHLGVVFAKFASVEEAQGKNGSISRLARPRSSP